MKGTNTFFFIKQNKVPKNKAKEVACDLIVCTMREMKIGKHSKRMIVGGNNIKHKGDIGTLTNHLETAKILFNSVLSKKMLNL